MSSNKPKFYVTCGPSASGKTTFTKSLKQDFVNVNNDDLRRSLYNIDHWNEYSYDDMEKLITKTRNFLIDSILEQKKNIIVSNLNLNIKLLNHYYNFAKDNNYEFKVILFDNLLSTLLERNSNRDVMRLNDSIIISQYSRYRQEIEPYVLENFPYEYQE